MDRSEHSIFGASKVAADVFIQKYGCDFGLKTEVFRGECLTGPNPSATQLRGFLAYLIRCLIENREYVIFGHKGKQVGDNTHSYDLVSMFWESFLDPEAGEVYNVGRGRQPNCSMLEAIQQSEEIVGRKLRWSYSDTERNGDPRWYISNVEKFRGRFPSWNYTYGLSDILEEIADVPAKKQVTRSFSMSASWSSKAPIRVLVVLPERPDVSRSQVLMNRGGDVTRPPPIIAETADAHHGDPGRTKQMTVQANAEVKRLEQELREMKRANEILKKRQVSPGRSSEDDIVEGRELGFELICSVLRVAPDTYYAAGDRARQRETSVTR